MMTMILDFLTFVCWVIEWDQRYEIPFVFSHLSFYCIVHSHLNDGLLGRDDEGEK